MRRAAALAASLTACAGGGGGVDAIICSCDARVDAAADARSGPFDLQDGTWVVTNASNTPGTISHDGALGFTADGTPWIAFSEPLPTSGSDQDILVTSRSGSSWSGPVPLTSDTAVQNAYPNLVTVGDAVHVVWNGYPEGPNDLYHAVNQGAGWSARENLTLSSEIQPRDDFTPSLARAPNGQLAVAYASHLDTGDTDAEIRVFRFPSAIDTAIPSPQDGQSCFDPAAAFDAEGHLHVVAECGPLFAGNIIHASDATGSWVRTPLDVPGARPALAVDGADVHIVWASIDEDIYYAVSRAGGPFGEPVNVTESQSGLVPKVAVDSAHRAIVMFQRRNAGNEFDIWVTWTENGSAFAPARNVTEGTDASTEWFPYSLLMHPVTGLPHLTFTKLIPDSSPVDSDVMHAEFVPGD